MNKSIRDFTLDNEIERKYLVTAPPLNYKTYPSSLIQQAYLSIDDNGAEVRLRKNNDLFCIKV